MKPEVILFTKPDCEKCDYVKARIPADLELKIMDITSADGMAHAAFHELIGKYTPILVVDDEVVEGALRIKNKMKELAKEEQ